MEMTRPFNSPLAPSLAELVPLVAWSQLGAENLTAGGGQQTILLALFLQEGSEQPVFHVCIISFWISLEDEVRTKYFLLQFTTLVPTCCNSAASGPELQRKRHIKRILLLDNCKRNPSPSLGFLKMKDHWWDGWKTIITRKTNSKLSMSYFIPRVSLILKLCNDDDVLLCLKKFPR